MFANSGYCDIVERLSVLVRPFPESQFMQIRSYLIKVALDYVKGVHLSEKYHDNCYITESKYMIKMFMEAIMANDVHSMECRICKMLFYLRVAMFRQQAAELRPLDACLPKDLLSAMA